MASKNGRGNTELCLQSSIAILIGTVSGKQNHDLVQ